MIFVHFDFADMESQEAHELLPSQSVETVADALSKISSYEAQAGDTMWHKMHVVRGRRGASLGSTKTLPTPQSGIPQKWLDIAERRMEGGVFRIHIMGMWGNDPVCLTIEKKED